MKEGIETYKIGYNQSESFSGKLKKLVKQKKFKELFVRGIIFVRGRIIREKIMYTLFKTLNTKKTFIMNKKKYNYLINSKTFYNERMAEAPIFKEIIKENKSRDILEVGNVMSNFMDVKHDIVDKYEVAHGVINEDVTDFSPKKKYDIIISVSTLEHVGWDEIPKEPKKILKAINNLKKITKKDGTIFFSIPYDYNHTFDALIKDKTIKLDEAYFLRRGTGNTWAQTNYNTIQKTRFNWKVPRANGIVIGIIKN